MITRPPQAPKGPRSVLVMSCPCCNETQHEAVLMKGADRRIRRVGFIQCPVNGQHFPVFGHPDREVK